MADYKKVVEMWDENLASFLELAKKLLVDWAIEPKKLLHLFQNIRKDDLSGLLAGTHEIKVKETQVNAVLVDNDRFGLPLTEFEVTVTLDYDHDTQIDRFQKKVNKLKTTYYYNDALTSSNFAKATNKLTPGKTYKVKIFPILSKVTSEDCMNFLRKQNAILVGGQGLTLAQELKADEFPIGKFTVSFDKKEALWKESDGRHGMSGVYRDSDGDCEFILRYFEGGWGDAHCLLCFCEL